MPRRATWALVVLIGAVAVGCGGDGGGEQDDENAIRDVIRLSLTTEDHRADCRDRLSSALIRKTYGTRTRCVRVQKDDKEDSADGVSFSRIRVDGDGATAGIRVRGGSTDGATGELELVREDGDWRIDDLSVALLRSLVEAGLQDDDTLPAGASTCISRALTALPDAELRSIAYELIGETDAGERRTFQILADCPGEGGRSLLHQLFEQGIVESLRKSGSSQRQVQCVVRRLRADLSDDELTDLLTRKDSQAATTRALTPVLAACQS